MFKFNQNKGIDILARSPNLAFVWICSDCQLEHLQQLTYNSSPQKMVLVVINITFLKILWEMLHHGYMCIHRQFVNLAALNLYLEL
jgi:hypothetical protein